MAETRRSPAPAEVPPLLLPRMTTDFLPPFGSNCRRAGLALAGALGLGLATAPAQVTYNFAGANAGGWTATRTDGDDATAWQAGATGWVTAGWNGGNDMFGNPATYFLSSPTLTVTGAGTLTGSFTHRFNFESGYDGGQFQYAVNGGDWTAVPQGLITGTTYTETVSGSALDGQLAFSGMSAGYAGPSYVTSNFTLGAGAPLSFSFGDQVQVRFVAAWDSSVVEGTPNWEVAGITLNGISAVPEPSTYALAAGSCALAGAWWRRRRQRRV
jgi:hypothetical protein